MTDAAPIELAGMFLEWQRIEDAKAELAEQSKDLFKAAKGKGYDTKAMRAVFREKRVELEASPEDVAKAEEAEAMNDLYRSALDRGLTTRARPAHDTRENIEEFPSANLSYSQSGLSYADEKGRGDAVGKTDAIPFDPETGELTDNQESGTAGSCNASPISQAADESEQDDAVAPASSTNSNSAASSSRQPDTAGAAPPPAVPATPSDPYAGLEIPEFLRRTDKGCMAQQGQKIGFNPGKAG